MPPEERSEDQKQPGREPLSPAKRKRLEVMLEHALKRAAGDRPDYDYASTLLTECVVGDPANIHYVKAYLENLHKKYDNNRSGAALGQIKGMGARSTLKKALSREDWFEVVEHGLKVLEINPWDAAALTALATAAKKLGVQETDPARRTGFFDVEFFFIQAALKASPEDPNINRLCAKALEERNNIEQAIVYWHRVEKFDPKDEEAKRSIAVLQTKRMRRQEVPEEEAAPKHAAAGTPNVEEPLSPEQRLLKKIKQEPDTLTHYFDLSQVFIQSERFAEAEKVLAKAYERFDHDPDVREKLEDAQIRHLRQSIARTADPEKKQKLREAFFQKELELYQNRCKRFPGHLVYRYELGYRYFLTKQYPKAIRELQSARHEPTRKGVCLLALGMCFQRIKQYRLAMRHYEEAVAEIPDRDPENKKLALYSAGRLALAIHDVETGEKYLTTLAGMDFAYKDVPKLLDKIAQFHQNQGPEERPGRPPDEKPPSEGSEDDQGHMPDEPPSPGG
ncbi:MAG: hypothetical protein JXB10_09840 [Pirellulales bacterium]|nr:hypothetical protein [Pirellulales bacterium]